MKNSILLLFVVVTTFTVLTLSCSKETAVVAPTDYSFTEEFDTVSKAVAKGWVLANNSKPIGTIGWIQGFFYVSQYHGYDSKAGGFVNYPSAGGFASNPAVSGTDFIMTTSECGNGLARLSNWLISPEVMVKNGDIVKFYTRTYDNPAIGADRLQVRLNVANGSSKVGVDSNSIGTFSDVLLDINPDYLLEGDGSYPGEWTQYGVTIANMPVAKKSRIAFRYYVPNGGPLGINSLGIGIDKFEFISK